MTTAMKCAITSMLCACALVAPAAARAERVTLPATSSPLPGSAFQGGDGDQDDFIDWGTLGYFGSYVFEQADPPGADDDAVFTADSRELEPGQWDYRTRQDAATPPAGDLQHVWYTIDDRGPEVFLNAAFLRAGSGDAHIVLDLSRWGGSWYNGRNGVPCRNTGDLVISLDREGTETSITVQEWETTAYSPYSGCPTTGVLRDVPVQADVDVQGAFNAASIPNHLSAGPASIDAGRFGELSINLSSIARKARFPIYGCFSYQSLWPHTRASTSDDGELYDVVDQTWMYPRNCTAWGTKFDDRNANGVQDAGEPGVPGVRIWADYNHDGELQDYYGEPWTVTDDQGRYQINDIREPYDLREELLTGDGRDGWTCSFPDSTVWGGFESGLPTGEGVFPCGWSFIDPGREPDAAFRDFGNYQAPRLTLRKELFGAPAGDAFDLRLDGDVVLAGARDGATVTLTQLTPGAHVVSEVPVGTSDPSRYDTTIDCHSDASGAAPGVVAGTTAGVTLVGGSDTECVLHNVRRGAPAIDLAKTAPATRERGQRIDYDLKVTNIGDVAFGRDTVDVSDPGCDARPTPAGQLGPGGEEDSSPDTLDPGDAWSYACGHDTEALDATCSETELRNTAEAQAGEPAVTARAEATTTLTCPEPAVDPGPGPTPPEPEEPESGGEAPPPAPTPDPTPAAAVAPEPAPPLPTPVATPGAALLAQGVPAVNVRGRVTTTGPRRCVRGNARLGVSVSRARSIVIGLDGRRVRRLPPSPLADRYAITLPTRALRAGRHTATVRVAFQRGSGSRAVTIKRVIRVCATAAASPPRPRPPAVTG